MKRRSHPAKIHGTKAPAFVVPPMFSGVTPPFGLLLREGYRGRLRPRSRAVFRPLLAAEPFQPRGPSLSGGVPLLMPVPRGVVLKTV